MRYQVGDFVSVDEVPFTKVIGKIYDSQKINGKQIYSVENSNGTRLDFYEFQIRKMTDEEAMVYLLEFE